jgi:hypothetical protein
MNRVSVRSVIFYVLTGAVLVILMTKTQQHLLPASLARQIGHNSESFLFALLVAAEIQILRPVPRGVGRLVGIVGGAAVLFALGAFVFYSDLPATVVTLNEPLLGAGFVLLYLGLPRSRATGLAAFLVTVVFVAIFFHTGFVLDQAESLVPLAMTGLALDVFDRTILQPDAEDEPGLRALWMVILVATAIALIPAAAWARPNPEGFLRLTIDYLQRAAEAYWGWLLIHAFFSYWLGSRWRRTTTDLHGPRDRVLGGTGT